jgi:hypothetical protein
MWKSCSAMESFFSLSYTHSGLHGSSLILLSYNVTYLQSFTFKTEVDTGEMLKHEHIIQYMLHNIELRIKI